MNYEWALEGLLRFCESNENFVMTSSKGSHAPYAQGHAISDGLLRSPARIGIVSLEGEACGLLVTLETIPLGFVLDEEFSIEEFYELHSKRLAGLGFLAHQKPVGFGSVIIQLSRVLGPELASAGKSAITGTLQTVGEAVLYLELKAEQTSEL